MVCLRRVGMAPVLGCCALAMWDNESERIGKQRCTPLGYALHVVSDLIGFLGLLLLLATGATVGDGR